MRVITGSARGRKLDYIRSPEVRPTTDRVKESVFSIIQFEVPGAVVLDLFAGSGQMGIEALSRGADLAVFVDDGREPQRIIRANLQSTGLLRSREWCRWMLKVSLLEQKTVLILLFSTRRIITIC